MAIPSSGPLAMTDIQTEFGGSNPISLNEYYAGGTYVPAGTSGTYGAVPSSGTISIQNFYGTSNVTQWLTTVQYTPNTSSLLNMSGLAIDSAKNVYVGGIARQSGDKGWIAKFNSAGALQWQYLYTLSGGESTVYQMTSDSSDNIYSIGTLAVSDTNLSIIKYNSSGTIQWQKSLGDGQTETGQSVAVASSGNIYTNGYAAPFSNYAQLFAKYDSSGNLQWQRTIRNQNSFGCGVGLDSSENAYFGGWMQPFRRMASITKYNSSGTFQWNKLYGNYGGNNFYIFALTTDSSGNTYATGTATNSAGQAMFTIKVNSSGTIQWQKQLLYSYSYAYGGGICLDSSGYVYVLGLDGGSGVPSGTSSPAVIAKYDSSGTLQFQRYLYTGVSGYDIGMGIQVDGAGSMLVGVTGGATGYFDLLAKLPTDGSKTGTYTVNGKTVLYTAASFTDGTLSESWADYGITDQTPTYTNSTSSIARTTGNLTTYITNI